MAASHLNDLMPTTFRSDLGVLVSRWTQQPSSAQLLRPIYDELATIALRHQAHYWLQDIRHRDLNDPEITRWLLATYFPDLAARLGQRLCVAYLANPALLGAITSAPSFVRPDAYRGSPFTIAFFSAEGDAYAWLTQEKNASPAALR